MSPRLIPIRNAPAGSGQLIVPRSGAAECPSRTALPQWRSETPQIDPPVIKVRTVMHRHNGFKYFLVPGNPAGLLFSSPINRLNSAHPPKVSSTALKTARGRIKSIRI